MNAPADVFEAIARAVADYEIAAQRRGFHEGIFTAGVLYEDPAHTHSPEVVHAAWAALPETQPLSEEVHKTRAVLLEHVRAFVLHRPVNDARLAEIAAGRWRIQDSSVLQQAAVTK